MTDRLGHKQTAAMFALLALGREVSNNELKEFAGFALTGAERTELNRREYVQSNTEKAPHRHKLTERGREWCLEELSHGRPPAPKPRTVLAAPLYAVLGEFARYLKQQNVSLDEVFGSAEPLTEEEIERRIRENYRKLVRSPDGWVGLADLRPLIGAPAEEVDVVLKKLSRAGKAHLVPEPNRKALTEKARQAAFRLGGEDNHLVRIEAL
ncbi:hypothetical protein FHX82_003810 [Amycolatopsis bartoniae]|uniref:Uncharacterized protein n=1 Tax=Amycolatopsis bartoniae TaxID=941986 RepID=A0A8H9M4P0_9PSEU|nr:hypothetical protein [Amycolatopsis bartoniae]MBB2936746.1 hypothetical protein [Amycolatopsis bartoniae]TVT09202.1 hypothetical protein FNH07_09910 [Amycolatopsis bartoniae]GHF49850.1 hypothetical protein GCM10017566_23600 [Amycolatopsis bartoniae]